MPLKDQVANYARRIVERAPDEDRLRELARPGRLALFRFSDDGIVPNNPRLPVLLYRKAVRFLKPYKNATVVDGLFALNGWGRSWRNGVYDFVHYHSQVHEALGIATGECRLELGGLKGRTLNLSAGDVVVLPAGTGHRLIDASRNLLVVGAYPAQGRYDECTDTRDRVEAVKRIAAVPLPKCDPVFGRQGPLLTHWSSSRQRGSAKAR